MNEAPTHCPMCKEPIDEFAECRTAEPYMAYNPMEGLSAWGAYDVPKETVCYTGGKWIHFRTPGKDKPLERLVLMTEAKD